MPFSNKSAITSLSLRPYEAARIFTRRISGSGKSSVVFIKTEFQLYGF